MSSPSFSDKEALLSLSQLVRPPTTTSPPFDIISALPRELAIEALRHLPVDVLLRVAQVCRLWSEVAQDDGIWLQKYTGLLQSKSLLFAPDDLPHPLVDATALKCVPSVRLLRQLVQSRINKSLAPAAATAGMRHAIEKSEMMQVARDSYPLWLRKRPSPVSNRQYFRLLPPESFAAVCPPPAMSSLWKMSYFYAVLDSQRPFITLHELCARPWKFQFKQDNFYQPMGPDPWCKFETDFTYSSSLFLQEGGAMHTMSWQFLNVVEGFAACNVQVAQYPPLRVGRHPETWAFTLENEYVIFTSRAHDEPLPPKPQA